LLEDYGKIFSGATAMKIKLEALAKGEVNTNIRPESILGNFERLLGRYKSGFSDEKVYDLKKYNVFSYLSGKDRVALKVAIFPYKDGSKIVYEAMLPYVIGADGSKEGYELPDKMKFDIEKIVND
jgi:hypothetical protein